MNKRYIIGLFGTALFLLLSYWMETGITAPDQQTKLKLKLMKPSNTEEIVININQWTYRMSNGGTYFANPAATRSGGFYPRGTGWDAIYAAGLYIGALKGDTIVVSDVEFITEFVPGKIVTSGGLDRLGGYRGSITYNTDSTYTDLFPNCIPDSLQKSEYEVYFIQSNVINDEYNKWKTIPYLPLTADGNPGLVADGQTYAVFNDMNLINQNQPVPLNGANPGLGLEVELESFAFANGGAANALANMVFLKFSITNKTTSNWSNAYLGVWADPDVGADATKDLSDVDSVAGLGYTYNSPATTDNAIIAVGVDFFQGPLVTASDVTADLTARFSGNNTRLRYDPAVNKYVVTNNNPGEFTLGATAFIGYRIDYGGPGPPLNDFDDKMRYRFMEGKDEYGAQKPGGKYDRQIGAYPSDQRIVLGTGPFVLHSGITQEIWLGIIGGQGTTNDPALPNSAIARVKAYDAVAQKAFSTGFSKPVILDNPTLSVTGADNHVILTWDNKAEFTADTYGEENGIIGGASWNQTYSKYDFQGYRLYKSLTGIENSFTRIAEYDLIDGITTVKDTTIEEDGSILINYKHIGSDSAFRHDYTDYNVKNGQVYYYAVTAFDYHPMYYVGGMLVNLESGATIPRSMETPLKTKTNFKSVVPQKKIAGYSYDAAIKNKSQIGGFNEFYYANGKTVQTRIVDASKIKNRTTFVQFFVIPDSLNHEPLRGFTSGTVAYRFIDSASEEILKTDYGASDNPLTYIDSNQNNIFDVLPNGIISTSSGDKSYDDSYFATAIIVRTVDGIITTPYQNFPVVDGVEYMPIEMQKGAIDVVQASDGSTALTTPRSVLNSPSLNGKWQIAIRDLFYSRAWINDLATALRLIDSNYNANNNNYEIQFSTAGATDTGYTRNSLSFNVTVNGTIRIPIPFRVTNIGGTLNGVNDISNDSLLIVKLIDKFLPLYPFSWGYDTTGLSFGYTNMISATRYPQYTTPLPVQTGACPNSSAAFTSIAFKANIAASDTLNFKANPRDWLPSAGTIVRIVTAKPFQSNDVFKFNLAANTVFSKSKAKNDLKSIRVVPNPYYGRADAYQKDIFDKKIKFTGLPEQATIYILDIAGNLIRKLNHNGLSKNDRINDTPDSLNVKPAAQFTGIEIWDLKNKSGRYVASGMYVALVDAKGIGKTFVKFAIIQERMRTSTPE